MIVWAGGGAVDMTVCEPMFVSIKGSPYVNFLRALDGGDILLVRAAAAELPSINLADALKICIVFAGGPDPGLYERAAVRWLGRFALEARDVELAELEQAAVALGAMPAHPEEALDYLSELCNRHGVQISRSSALSDERRFRRGGG